MDSLGDRLKIAREKTERTQIEVSKRIGINNKTLSNYENNVSKPDPIALKKEVYRFSIQYFAALSVSMAFLSSAAVSLYQSRFAILQQCFTPAFFMFPSSLYLITHFIIDFAQCQ